MNKVDQQIISLVGACKHACHINHDQRQHSFAFACQSLGLFHQNGSLCWWKPWPEKGQICQNVYHFESKQLCATNGQSTWLYTRDTMTATGSTLAFAFFPLTSDVRLKMSCVWRFIPRYRGALFCSLLVNSVYQALRRRAKREADKGVLTERGKQTHTHKIHTESSVFATLSN